MIDIKARPAFIDKIIIILKYICVASDHDRLATQGNIGSSCSLKTYERQRSAGRNNALNRARLLHLGQ